MDDQKFYVDYLDCTNNFKETRKWFLTWQDAKDWCLATMEKFNPDFIGEILD